MTLHRALNWGSVPILQRYLSLTIVQDPDLQSGITHLLEMNATPERVELLKILLSLVKDKHSFFTSSEWNELFRSVDELYSATLVGAGVPITAYWLGGALAASTWSLLRNRAARLEVPYWKVLEVQALERSLYMAMGKVLPAAPVAPYVLRVV